jgi:hypothetical protein
MMTRLITVAVILSVLQPGDALAQGRGIQRIDPAAIRAHQNAFDAVKAYGDGRWVTSCHSVSFNEAPQRPGTGVLRDIPTEFVTRIELIPFDYSHDLVRRGARCGTVVIYLPSGISRDSLSRLLKARKAEAAKPDTGTVRQRQEK